MPWVPRYMAKHGHETMETIMKPTLHFHHLFTLLLGWSLCEAADAANFTTAGDVAAKFGVHEITLTGDGSVANPFDTIATVTFMPPSGAEKAKTVHAFFDGENTWRARVYVSEPGEWKWSSQCATDRVLDGKRGAFKATDSKLRGRLLIHPKNPRQWMTEDGRWFLNLNDTSYFLLCSHDGEGNPVPDADVRAYVADATSRGITSFRSFIANGPKPFMGERGSDRHRWNDLFADSEMTRPDLNHLRVADQRLRWLLDAHPDAYMQFILFPLGKAWRTDEIFWTKLSAQQKERIMRHLIARFAAYPQLFWLIVNDAHFGPEIIKPRAGDTQTAPRTVTFPNSCAMVREVGAFFQKHDPWQHPLSTGPARTAAFHFENESWATYIHLEDSYDVAARRCDQYRAACKPVFLGEDRYEHDHPGTYDPRDMRYFQRRLFWAWLLSDGSANYGGRWWVLHPYSQTGQRPARSVHHPEHTFTAQLTGLDSVKHIRDFFESRRIELSDFTPDVALVKDADDAPADRAPKLMRRGHNEFLIYHPNAAADGREARPDANKSAGVILDLSAARGDFAAEWFRADNGESQAGGRITGGQSHTLRAPWKGVDCVLRLLLSD